MGKLCRSVALILTLTIAISSLSPLVVRFAYAQTTPTPSVPQFTVVMGIAHSDVPTTYSLDPLTGQIVAQLGQNEWYNTITLVVVNQNVPANSGSLLYNVRITVDQSSWGWTELFDAGTYPTASSGSYTNITLPIYSMSTFLNRTVNIQVEAMIGVISWGHNFPPIPSAFSGQASAWSRNQTVTVIDVITPLSYTSTPSSSQTSTQSPAPTQTSTSKPTSTAGGSSGSPSTSLWLIMSSIALIVIASLLAVIIALLFIIKRQNFLLRHH